jgi:ferredoxin
VRPLDSSQLGSSQLDDLYKSRHVVRNLWLEYSREQSPLARAPTLFNPTLCALSRRGVPGCTRCIDACPSQALQNINDLIEFDSEHCEGAGACAMLCPTQAIAYAPTTLGALVACLRSSIVEFSKAGLVGPRLCFIEMPLGDEIIDLAGLPSDVISAPVAQLSLVDHAVALTAFALGAREVVVLAPAETAEGLQPLLLEQATLINGILKSLRHDLCQFRVIADIAELVATRPSGTPPSGTPLSRTTMSGTQMARWGTPDMPDVSSRQSLMSFALAHLWDNRTMTPGCRVAGEHLPFGVVTVDESTCTLCMACVEICPTSALKPGGLAPALLFTESACIACGICERGCPESSISVAQALELDPVRRETSRALHTEPLVPCITCGTPHATASVIAKLQEALKDNPMFAGDGLSRLQMCDDCRFSAASASPGR